MKKFYSYGTIDYDEHFCVPRNRLVDKCVRMITGNPEKGGCYFTIWGSCQTGKTWLSQQVKQKIDSLFSDKFITGSMSMQGVLLEDTCADEEFFDEMPLLVWETFGVNSSFKMVRWSDFKRIFAKNNGIFDRPVILFIDEFDSLPLKIKNRLISLFCDMYLKRESYLLHGLALISHNSVLGVDNLKESLFDIRRSLHVSNFSFTEVDELFRQYYEETEQKIELEVIHELYKVTQGQPGLTSWFCELLTRKYNPGKDEIIDLSIWKKVYEKAVISEWNNSLLRMVIKAKGEYLSDVMDLFTSFDMKFGLDTDWCNSLYYEGIMDIAVKVANDGEEISVRRFSSPFIQHRLFNELASDMAVADCCSVPVLEYEDDLSDIFKEKNLNLFPLFERYEDYLSRLKAQKQNFLKCRQRKNDKRLTRADGHFYFYAWIKEVLSYHCVVNFRFPAEKGTVNLHIKCGNKQGVIEIKRFKNFMETEEACVQAADNARQSGIKDIFIALFVQTENEGILDKISGIRMVDGIRVRVIAFLNELTICREQYIDNPSER